MENFLKIFLKPDNLPIAGMVLAIFFVLWVALKQAFKHDKLIAEGKRDQMYKHMIK